MGGWDGHRLTSERGQLWGPRESLGTDRTGKFLLGLVLAHFYLIHVISELCS